MFESDGGPLLVSATGNQPLELKVNGQRALRLDPSGSGAFKSLAEKLVSPLVPYPCPSVAKLLFLG